MLTILETIAIALISGCFGSILVCLTNLIVQDKREKRLAIESFLHGWFGDGGVRVLPREVFNTVVLEKRALLPRVYIAFSNSLVVRRRLRELDIDVNDRKCYSALLKAMCRSAWVRYDKVLLGREEINNVS